MDVLTDQLNNLRLKSQVTISPPPSSIKNMSIDNTTMQAVIEDVKESDSISIVSQVQFGERRSSIYTEEEAKADTVPMESTDNVGISSAHIDSITHSSTGGQAGDAVPPEQLIEETGSAVAENDESDNNTLYPDGIHLKSSVATQVAASQIDNSVIKDSSCFRETAVVSEESSADESEEGLTNQHKDFGLYD